MNLLRFDAAANFRQIKLQKSGYLFGRENCNRLAATFAMRRMLVASGANNRDTVRFNRYLSRSVHHFFSFISRRLLLKSEKRRPEFFQQSQFRPIGC